MPIEETEIQEIPPEWFNWTEQQSRNYVDANAESCSSCSDTLLVRAVRYDLLPSFIVNDDEAAHQDWVHTLMHTSRVVGDTPLMRWEHLRNYGGICRDYYADVHFEYLDGGTTYELLCSGCMDSLSDENSAAEDAYRDESESEYVRDYSYRPRIRFYDAVDNGVSVSGYPALSDAGVRGVLSPASYDGAQPVQRCYLGFELEMTRNQSSTNVDGAASQLYHRCGDFSYMKWDGSVENGFELVTHPHTLDAYNARTELWEALDYLRSCGWRSWNSNSSCGLHVHVNNASFSSVGHAMRFLMFIYKNREPLVRFAGRDSHFARFEFDQFVQRQVHVGWNDDGSPQYAVGTVADIVKKKQVNDSRYLAVNAQNTHTYELRFFRGNMNPNAVRACLEFVYSLHEYTENLTSHDCLVNRALTWRPFLAFIRRKSTEPNFQYRRLYDRLTLSRRNGDNGFINTSGAE